MNGILAAVQLFVAEVYCLDIDQTPLAPGSLPTTGKNNSRDELTLNVNFRNLKM